MTDLNQEMHPKPLERTPRDSTDGIRRLTAPSSAPAGRLAGAGRAGVGWGGWGGRGHMSSPSPTAEPSIMPPSYAIIFALRPISTWEQCKLFKTLLFRARNYNNDDLN